MNLFFQRGRGSNERGYLRDLKATVFEPVEAAKREALVRRLAQGGYLLESRLLSGQHPLRLWGGPGGIRGVFEKINPGDLCFFIVDDAFKFVARAVQRLDIDETTARTLAQVLWQQEDYPHIWTMDQGATIPEVWRRTVGQTCFGNELYFVRGKGAVFPHQLINFNSRDEGTLGGQTVRDLLSLLNVTPQCRERLLQRP